VSGKFWIYWVVSAPFTVFMVYVWRAWLGGSDRNIRSKWLHGPRGDGGAGEGSGGLKRVGTKLMELKRLSY
jgi:hypothetical protein